MMLLAELGALDAVQNNCEAAQNFIFRLVNLSRYEIEIITKKCIENAIVDKWVEKIPKVLRNPKVIADSIRIPSSDSLLSCLDAGHISKFSL